MARRNPELITHNILLQMGFICKETLYITRYEKQDFILCTSFDKEGYYYYFGMNANTGKMPIPHFNDVDTLKEHYYKITGRMLSNS